MTLHQFLNESYTAFHTTANVVKILKENGFSELTLGEKLSIKRGGKYYVTRNGSSVIAFVVGNNNVFNIIASHTDSPSFKIKGNKVVQSDIARLSTEKYGGALLYAYYDRPMKVAGRLLVETANGVDSKLVVSDYNVVIPSLAIHQNRGVNDNFAVNPQGDTFPLFASSAADVYSSLTDGKVLDADLYVVPAIQAFNSGVKNEFLCSARLDNLTSVYTSVQGLIGCNPSSIAVIACLDNEEIGSGTRQGNPSFIDQTLNALCDGLGLNNAEKLAARENGIMLSVDNGQARHPAFPQKSDPETYAVLGGGVTIKHHVNYATDGLTAAIVKKLLKDNGIEYQDLYNRSDMSCGSTLGLAASRILGIKTCDIGIAQLAMHSACETCAVKDIEAMQKCLKAFLSASINACEKSVTVHG